MLLVFGKENVTEINIKNKIGYEIKNLKLGEFLIEIIQKFGAFFDHDGIYNRALCNDKTKNPIDEAEHEKAKSEFISALMSLTDAERLIREEEVKACFTTWRNKMNTIYSELNYRRILTNEFLKQPLLTKIQQSELFLDDVEISYDLDKCLDIENTLEKELNNKAEQYNVQLCCFNDEIVCAFNITSLEERINLEYWYAICNQNTLRTRVCPVCGKLFEGKNRKKIYCSERCRSKNEEQAKNSTSPYYAPYRHGYQYNNNVYLNYPAKSKKDAQKLYDSFRKKAFDLYKEQENLYLAQTTDIFWGVDAALLPLYYKNKEKKPQPMPLEDYKKTINEIWQDFRNELKKLPTINK